MKRHISSWMWVMGVVVVVALLLAPAATMKPAADKLTVTGTVTETKDAKGRASYALQTDQGEHYVLSKHAKGVELRKLIGKKVITVTEYKEIQ